MLRPIARLATVLLLLLSNADVAAEPQSRDPLAKAYAFLYEQMDRYQHGGTPRLPQSYVPTATFSNGDVSYTYDDAVMIIALLARGTSDDVVRARVLGDSLLYAQAHDPARDGRVRDAYHANALIGMGGTPNVANAASHTGNLAWTGMAFGQLYRATGDLKYLKAALALGNFTQQNFYDARGIEGYTGGFEANGAKVRYKSAEHNIDLYALFTMLARLTNDAAWRIRADHAQQMIAAMWDTKQGFFWIGTGLDGERVNKLDPIPEDVQSWSFLSLHLVQYRGSIDWALANLSATSGSFQGLSFAANDRTGVWFEGTAHAAAALAARNLGQDSRATATLLSDVETGQAGAPNANGRGVDAASKDGLKTGDGADNRYYAALHIATTAWYCIAKQSANPFRLLR
ncbi:MAG: hypothetical protein ACJ8EL_12665 [Rhizomicrobium sp.]